VPKELAHHTQDSGHGDLLLEPGQQVLVPGAGLGGKDEVHQEAVFDAEVPHDSAQRRVDVPAARPEALADVEWGALDLGMFRRLGHHKGLVVVEGD
jgi:hypothetical protein